MLPSLSHKPNQPRSDDDGFAKSPSAVLRFTPALEAPLVCRQVKYSFNPGMMGKDQTETGEEDNDNERDDHRYHIGDIGADERPGKLLIR